MASVTPSPAPVPVPAPPAPSIEIIYGPAPIPAPAPPPDPVPVRRPTPQPAPPVSIPTPRSFGVTGVIPLADLPEETALPVEIVSQISSFAIINVAGQPSATARRPGDQVTFVGQNGISITVNSTTNTITWSGSGTGIAAVVAGNGIEVATSNNTATVTNTGILSVVSGNGISVSTANGNATVTNTGILNINAGNSINVVTANGSTTVTNTFTETVYNGGNASGNVTPDRNNGSIQKFTLTGNIVLLPVANIAAGQWITLVLTQDGVGNRLLDANTAYLFASGFQTLTTDSGAIDMLNIFYDGTNYYATLTVDYS